VAAYVTVQRTREIGIRVALGAQASDVTGLFVRHGLLLAGLGVVLGAGAAATLSRLMTSMLFGVSATDPATYLASSATLAAVTAFAVYLPSRRAVRADPAAVLRRA
jgi:ABC-type antimicrobial peptide transport system permease subunit